MENLFNLQTLFTLGALCWATWVLVKRIKNIIHPPQTGCVKNCSAGCSATQKIDVEKIAASYNQDKPQSA